MTEHLIVSKAEHLAVSKMVGEIQNLLAGGKLTDGQVINSLKELLILSLVQSSSRGLTQGLREGELLQQCSSLLKDPIQTLLVLEEKGWVTSKVHQISTGGTRERFYLIRKEVTTQSQPAA